MSSTTSPAVSLSPTSHESNSNTISPRTGKPKPTRKSPASAFLSHFQQSVPDTAKYPPLRAPTSTPALSSSSQPASSIATSGTGSPRTEPTPADSSSGRSNVKANLTAASSYLSDFMTAKKERDDWMEKTVVDIVVPRPVVAAAAVEELGKQAKAGKLTDEHVSETDGTKTSTAVPCSS